MSPAELGLARFGSIAKVLAHDGEEKYKYPVLLVKPSLIRSGSSAPVIGPPGGSHQVLPSTSISDFSTPIG